MEHETAFEKTASLGQLKEIMATLVQAVPADLPSYEAQRIIENKGWLVSEVKDLFAFRKPLLDEWVQFYQEVFGLEVNFSNLKLPKRLPGFTRLLVVAKGLSLKRMLEVSKKHYAVDDSPTGRYYFGEEETRGTHDRVPTDAYAVWVRDQVVPELKYTDFHPRLLKERGVQGITLLEHLLFHLKYFRETGEFLDRNEIRTLCFGSRDAYGCIPCVILRKWQSRNPGVSLTYGQLHVSVREVIA